MSTNKKIPITFCFGDLETIKQAILFFDCIVPFPFEAAAKYNDDNQVVASSQVVKTISEYIPINTYNYILHPISTVMREPHKYGGEGLKLSSMFKMYLILMQLFANKIYLGEPFTKNEIGKTLNELSEFGFQPNIIVPEKKLANPDANIDDISIMLSGLELIDTRLVSWDQLLEYRENENSKKKLRNLRLFLMSNYKAKSRQFIEDDLGKRIDDYSNVVKEYGFETKTSTLTLISNSKNLKTFGTASLIAALLGEPILASTSLLTGVGLDLLNITLEFVKKRHAFQKFKREHDLAYIIDFQRQFKEENNNI